MSEYLQQRREEFTQTLRHRREEAIVKLKGARQLIEQGWTQAVYARNAEGKQTPFGSADACSFCGEGALFHQFPATEGDTSAKLASDLHLENALLWHLNRSIERLYGHAIGMIAFNDMPGQTQESVLAVFDHAIQKLERQQRHG